MIAKYPQSVYGVYLFFIVLSAFFFTYNNMMRLYDNNFFISAKTS